MSDENEPDDVVGVLTTGASTWWSKVLPLRSFREQTGELIGDIARRWRFNNLARIMEMVNKTAQQKGLRSSQARTLAMHVGLPWVEKASYCDNSALQEKWGQLFLSLATRNNQSYSSAATYMRILEQLDPFDCLVLDTMVKSGGVSKSYFRYIDSASLFMMVGRSTDDGSQRTVLSVEKLVRCGCLDRLKIEASTQNFAISMHGNMGSFISLTLTGLNFHIAVTGEEPGWLNLEDSTI